MVTLLPSVSHCDVQPWNIVSAPCTSSVAPAPGLFSLDASLFCLIGPVLRLSSPFQLFFSLFSVSYQYLLLSMTFWCVHLIWWSSRVHAHQHHPEASLKHGLRGPLPEILMQEVWGGAWECASLPVSQVVLTLLVQGPLFENHWFTSPCKILKRLTT